jgi:hypothetical protein
MAEYSGFRRHHETRLLEVKMNTLKLLAAAGGALIVVGTVPYSHAADSSSWLSCQLAISDGSTASSDCSSQYRAAVEGRPGEAALSQQGPAGARDLTRDLDWIGLQLRVTDGFSASDYTSANRARAAVEGRAGEAALSQEGAAGAPTLEYQSAWLQHQLHATDGYSASDN